MTIKAVISGTGFSVPDKVVTNKDLEKIVDTSDQWITERTGIKERRFAGDDITSSTLATDASEQAIGMAGVDPLDIDLILLATVTPDMFFPSTACLVQADIGAEKAAAFDFSAGCSGYLYGLSIAQQYITNGTYEHILVIGVETLSKIMDMTDRSTCVLFGDGAGASLVSSSEVHDSEHTLLATYMMSDGRLGHLLEMPAGGSRIPASVESVEKRLHYIKMEGNEVFKNAVRAMRDASEMMLELGGITPEDVDFLIPHQANTRIIKGVQKRLKLSDDQVYINIHKYGNTSAGSIPIALAEAVEGGMLKEGDDVVMVAFGAGFTWASALLRW